MVEIAIIEHNPKLSSSLQQLVNEQHGFRCRIAESRIGAFFEKLNLSLPPDILVLDTFLKNGSVLDHLPKLKMLLPQTKLMIHSGEADEELLFKALKKGINAFLLKDNSSAEFVATLQRLEQGEDYIDPRLSSNIINIFQRNWSAPLPPALKLGSIAQLLNEREAQVVRGLVDGKPYKEIASDLFLSINTIRHYVKSIYRKAGVHSRTGLMRMIK
ncbi:MAG: response regulator transcription factor [Saprospiraceae bacterium]